MRVTAPGSKVIQCLCRGSSPRGSRLGKAGTELVGPTRYDIRTYFRRGDVLGAEPGQGLKRVYHFLSVFGGGIPDQR
jgi:hypothetical protein